MTPSVVVIGTAGASARREHQRREQRREERVRAAHPRIGGLLLALTDAPQSTRAWSTGAGGEERLAARLAASAGEGLRLLHDRRIPRSRTNIDHIAVAPTGVYVIDAKRYQGRPDVRAEGGLLRPRVERLVVGRRDCTPLLDGLDKQIAAVPAALADARHEVQVHGVLCFVDAAWPLLGGDLTVRGVRVLSPKKLQRRLAALGDTESDVIEAVHGALAAALPPA